jgi:hypothetical protein
MSRETIASEGAGHRGSNASRRSAMTIKTKDFSDQPQMTKIRKPLTSRLPRLESSLVTTITSMTMDLEISARGVLTY